MDEKKEELQREPPTNLKRVMDMKVPMVPSVPVCPFCEEGMVRAQVELEDMWLLVWLCACFTTKGGQDVQ